MEKEFVPFELAVKLGELGFDGECFGWYNISENDLRIYGEDLLLDGYAGEECRPNAPLYSQAFDWLLKECKLYGIVIPTITMHWTFKTMTVVEDMVEVPPYNHVDSSDYGTFEEARLACLEKLIEIVEDGKSGN